MVSFSPSLPGFSSDQKYMVESSSPADPDPEDFLLKTVVEKAGQCKIFPNSSIYERFYFSSVKRTLRGWDEELAEMTRGEFVKCLQPFYKKRVQKRYSFLGKKILELGCGNLKNEESEESHLSRMMPNCKKSWQFSDRHSFKSMQLPSLSSKYVKIDLNESIPPRFYASFDRTIASNVLDVLPYQFLDNALLKIKNLLKRGGIFVHVAELPFFLDSFADAAAQNHNDVCLPLMNYSGEIGRVNKREYVDTLKGLSEKERNFFSSWGKYHNQIQSSVLVPSFIYSLKNFEKARIFEQQVKTVFKSCLKIVKPLELFELYLKAAAKKVHLKILQCGYQSEIICISRPKDDLEFEGDNYFTYGKGFTTASKIYVLAPGKIMYACHIHVYSVRKE